MSESRPRRALVSVSDKTGLASFVQGLVQMGFEILSTGGTRRFLEEQGITVLDISSYTGFPEIMEGRVKTLHPKVHGAILGRPDRPGDAQAMAQHGIVPFELVVCNLYPFEQTIAKEGVTVEEAIEQIDIGGPCMVRAAAKNHAYVGIVTSPDQYPRVLDALRQERFDLALRRELAVAAFEMTARYDRAIADYMARLVVQESADQASVETAAGEWPAELTLTFRRRQSLRYGENPHQKAAFYVEPDPHPATLAGAEQFHGKELSYNNLLDLDAALAIAREFDEPAAVVIKHNNPCGCAVAETLSEAFDKAYAGDPVSAFGSILGFNREVDFATAERLCEPNRFIEAIIAPGYEPAAVEALTTRPKWKKNVRLLKCPALNQPRPMSHDLRRVSGGVLVQDRDELPEPFAEWTVQTNRQPTDQELADLRFAWLVCKHVKSNAIVLAKDRAIVGVGAGQMSRLDSSFLAAYKAGDRSRGSVLASDAFFPFRDAVDEAAKAGVSVTAIAQPGGSRNDQQVIDACNELGLAMVFTGRRHFRH
ncbi:MAG: bifunctional phosphoribosylaminoimidazolecarboxamide formyltransferase/IMP cyclohydrolase [Planctomycetes bacterium]|nr:bifunctional phosphoribosylaminoimidazolecarboxamide formyltransferase/IMP cyclohydrolase [Planctomycetota bacterium]